ncbi:dynamin family protein [Chroococcidiopsis thermalis]|uniref:Dynamin family protein n=1 Tax=Chroococcidiopsis thermalis (strain PCC 7203) TaxID=251229 RepID=K9TUT3_CHRTP|nr:dynamin family protein [Chroococcidiopsis thermalis]AFY86295.1 Dynamin family protein [Chroococcidiopsis thermalis PCC 7203]
MNTSSEYGTHNNTSSTSYEKFQMFQKYRQWLYSLCDRLAQIIYNPSNQYYQKDTSLLNQLKDISEKLRSQRFRVAVIGDFSQGKSTLINALVKKEIQPIRAIACSRTLTVLKDGTQQRILGQYKDGRIEEISYEQYRVLSTITKDAARQYHSDEFYHPNIEEIIFEHPDFDLCQNGVEIVDSPGLNEHPARAEITRKLIKDADALIFITDASQALTQTERQLIDDIRRQINEGKEDKPLANIFLVVNKIDNLDSEEDLQDVQAVVNEFAYGKNPMLAGEHRVHYISAKSVLKALSNNNQNEYLYSFQKFVQALENFLANERGSLKIQNAITAISKVSQKYIANWNVTIEDTEKAKNDILEEIGVLSGHSVRIENSLIKKVELAASQLSENMRVDWHHWINLLGLKAILNEKSKNWYSGRDVVWDQHGIIKDYVDLCIKDSEIVINLWINEKIQVLVEKGIKNIEEKFFSELNSIDKNKLYNEQFRQQQIKNNTCQFEKFKFDVGQKGGYGDLWRWITCILFVGYFFGSADEIVRQMKEKVVEVGINELREHPPQVLEDIHQEILIILKDRISIVDNFFIPMLSNCTKTLECKESEYIKILEKQEEEITSITQYQQELEELKQQVKLYFNQY